MNDNYFKIVKQNKDKNTIQIFTFNGSSIGKAIK